MPNSDLNFGLPENVKLFMKPNHKKRWLEALRSGKYTQGQDYLKVKTEEQICKFCCLGVFAELLNVTYVELPKQRDSDYIQRGGFKFFVNKKPRSDLPPTSWFDQFFELQGAGDRSKTAQSNLRYQAVSDFITEVATMNDSGYNFSLIADYIETYV